MVALSTEAKWRKAILDKRNSSPIGWTLFRLLSDEELISMANFIGADFRTAVGVRGYDTATIKTRAAWDAQVIALLIALDKKEIHGNFLDTIVPSDKDAIKSIKAIEEFNIESTKNVYDGANWLLHKVSYEMLVNPLKSSEVLRRNQRISQAVLVLVYKYLDRYCKSLKISSKKVLSRDSINWLDFNSWDDFFGEYQEEMVHPLNCILKGWIKIEKIKSRQLLEMVKKFILFNYSISFGTYNIDKLNYECYSEAIINEVHSIAAIGRALYPTYCNVSGIKRFIEECFPEIKKSKIRSKIMKEIKLECTSSLTIEELAQLSLKEKNNKTHENEKEFPKNQINIIPKDFKTEYMKYYNNEICLRNICNTYKVSRTTIMTWRDKLNLPIVNVKERSRKDVPLDFTENYMKYYNGILNREAICTLYSITPNTLRRWRDKANLPKLNSQIRTSSSQNYSTLTSSIVKIKNMKQSTILVEPPVQVFPVEKPTLKFSLFGYEFSFTAKKKEPQVESINLSDEFPDEIEY